MNGAQVGNDVSATQLDAMLARGEVVLIDVREPDEFAAGHIAGARNFPLSTFDPSALPLVEDKRIVLQCTGGKRSRQALERCAEAGRAGDTQLAGGLAAWKEAGLPVVQGQGK